MFRPGDVVVSETSHNWLGRFLRWGCRSPWTHAFIVVSPTTLVESFFWYGVRTRSLPDRVTRLQTEGRAYITLHDPSLTKEQRLAVVAAAMRYWHRRYDPLQAIAWRLSGRFWRDGKLRLICSRLITAAYGDMGHQLFPASLIATLRPRHRQNLTRGYAMPEDILIRSALQPRHVWCPLGRGLPRPVTPGIAALLWRLRRGALTSSKT